ncbi:c-type cytochrome [Candidatus Rariloculus sp.]|uniref:c-type cytochrome n=1 Tax=Candidatus Rariloculus sp. TaxID=3101265 RepID=UPI003D0F3973
MLRRLLFACMVAGFVPGALAQDAADRTLYVSYGCYQCHGYEGQGGAALRIAPSVYPLEAFAQFVRRPPNEMPAYAREVLSDDDLRGIYRYVRSVAEPPPLAEFPILR